MDNKISLRVSVASIQQTLAIDDQQFANLRVLLPLPKGGADKSLTQSQAYSRQVNLEMCADSQLRWADSDLEWSKLPTREVQEAMRLLRERCTDLFSGKLDTPAVDSAMRGRLYQARRNWQQKKRSKSRSQHADVEAPRTASPTEQVDTSAAPDAPAASDALDDAEKSKDKSTSQKARRKT